MSARTEWETMSEQAQMRMITGCVVKAAHKRGARVNPLDYAGDTWLRVMDKLDMEKDLVLICMDAAEMALQKGLRHERKAAACADFEVMGADGNRLGSVLDLVAGCGSVENEAVTRVDFGVFFAALDAVNQQIVEGLALGRSMREIAPEIGITHTAINKRVAKMREMLTVCMG